MASNDRTIRSQSDKANLTPPDRVAKEPKRIAKSAERSAARASAAVVALARTETVEAKALEEAFAKARESRLKWPKMEHGKVLRTPEWRSRDKRRAATVVANERSPSKATTRRSVAAVWCARRFL